MKHDKKSDKHRGDTRDEKRDDPPGDTRDDNDAYGDAERAWHEQ